MDRFDPARNLKLKTFAEHRIHGALMDYLRLLDPLPRMLRDFQKKRDAALESLSEAPTCEQAAQLLGLSTIKYLRLCLTLTASETIPLEEAPLSIQRLAS